MNPIEILGALGWTYKSVLKRFVRGSLWVPFLVLLVVQGLILWILMSFHRPWAQGLAAPLLNWVGGEPALHYPFFYQVLPTAFARMQIITGVLVGSVISAVATLRFAGAFGAADAAGSWGRAFKRYLPVVLYSAGVSAVVFGVFSLQSLVPQDQMLTNQKVRWGVRLGTLGLAILVEAFFVYTLAWMFIQGKNVIQALGLSLKFMGRHFFTTAWLVAIPVLLKYPLSWLAGRSDLFVTKFQPEAVTTVVISELVLETLLSFVFVGTVTFYFLWRQDEEARA